MIIIILYYSVQSEKREELTDKEEYVHLHVTTRWWWRRREGKGIKILTPKKLLTRLTILLAQIKAGNNSYKYYIFCISTIKSLKKFTTI